MFSSQWCAFESIVQEYGSYDKTRIMVITGPTGSGKSCLAEFVAECMGEFLGVGIINADSMQVYRDLSVVTSRPVSDCGYGLYGIMGIPEVCSVGLWRRLVIGEIDKYWERGCLPILVGGSGLYLRGLAYGLSEIPVIPEDIREEVRMNVRMRGLVYCVEQLSEYDSSILQSLHPTDTQRLIRACEVLLATGRSLRWWQGRGFIPRPEGMKIHWVILLPSRQSLYSWCGRRFEGMMVGGAVEEVCTLEERGGIPEYHPLGKAIGVRELQQYIRGFFDRSTTILEAQKATRHYVKRQLTWLRNQLFSCTCGHDEDWVDVIYQGGEDGSFLRQRVMHEEVYRSFFTKI